jgi:hypothetical protein
MFGWFTTFGTTPRLRLAAQELRWLKVSTARFARALPSLGCVLYLPSHAAAPTLARLPRGWLAADAGIAPLLATTYLCAGTAVTPEGPREWLECMDRHGRTVARIYLLPDTDYLAWDAMLAAATAVAPLDRAPRGQRFVPAHARIVAFTRRAMPPLAILGAWSPGALSTIGRSLAGDIAVAEAVRLVAQH